MSYLALLIGKLLRMFLGLLGRGSSLPGKIALKIDRNILSKFEFPPIVIFVTGTNGKTSTTHYLSNVFAKAQYKTMTNLAGANLAQGIITQALEYSSFNFKIKADAVVLEVDEATLPNVIEDIKPSHILMLNLFPDQEDRFGSVEELAIKLNNAIVTDSKLILNANDPRLAWIGESHPELDIAYYGVDKILMNQPSHTILCPNCQQDLSYQWEHYEHLGYYSCSSCDFKIPPIQYLAAKIDFNQQVFDLNGFSYPIPRATSYTLFNVLAAVSLALDLGIKEEIIYSAIDETEIIRGRNERIELLGKEITINLAKNPAGMNQSISNLLSQETENYNLMLAVNNQAADGVSIAWLKDCDFTRLLETPLQHIYLSGSVRDNLYQILLDQGIPQNKISIEDISSGLDKLQAGSEHAYIIANYTSLNSIYKYIK